MLPAGTRKPLIDTVVLILVGVVIGTGATIFTFNSDIARLDEAVRHLDEGTAHMVRRDAIQKSNDRLNEDIDRLEDKIDRYLECKLEGVEK
uniref:Uncharacterized protein n=1 Tax=Candidatus Kentrum eta TaxID=2126337 RepID=A0A450VFL4_9GAMM|nr:MAG: hypothetical protein BECKH772B_GA0070898_1001831 [Candidatus Kentron sp. H]VFK03609.1 MAG: hypothetical protein BECKH772A_GA0070896_103392 [Candidatus Kentron sp. H]VFK06213.1 MAG: hypothetical protein BECKH772C_GA0070978_103342 [Candidatus Kentron sp. H]